jgi:hypothetical protein
LLDAQGIQVGDFIRLSDTGVSRWIVVGGTAIGFVNIFSSGSSAHGVFVAKPNDGGPPDAGVDAGSPTYPGFSFPTTASTAQIISDDTGGANGVGAVFLEQNGASFLYVKNDGLTRLSTGTVISSTAGSQVSISNYRGSFAVSLHETTTHSTYVIASECGR